MASARRTCGVAVLAALLAFAAAILPAGSVSAAPAACPDQAQARAAISQTIDDFFDALRSDDAAAFARLTTRSFYAFDVGQRYDGAALADAVRSAHAEGTQINWSLGPKDTKVSCAAGWSAWENVGSAGLPSALRPVRWLESAVLVHEDGRWKIDFFHSQRAAENVGEKAGE